MEDLNCLNENDKCKIANKTFGYDVWVIKLFLDSFSLEY